MTGVKSKALVLLHEEQFKKGKFFLHVELIPARQADIVRKKREKDGFKHLSIILGTSSEFQLCPGENVNISIKGTLRPAKSPVSGQMTIEFDGGNNCYRHFALAVNESDESSLAEVTFTRTKTNQFILQVTIAISEYRAKDKPTLQWNDLNATGTCNTLDHKENIPGGPDSLNDNMAKPIPSKDFPKDLNDSMKRLNIFINRRQFIFWK
ncbi:hypothetical protein CHS0354_032835 [Potamilus streckersoni]|uniref:Uncharacterized protein n=1 Tax=Potamilus streckersoni TaxID=2493646 RepID=A0AAE0S9G2_9BIVA|nr:hypothetical protein CHS0354_032835 [Potamilus streckersoni]